MMSVDHTDPTELLHVAFVLDESGSMEPLAGAVIEDVDESRPSLDALARATRGRRPALAIGTGALDVEPGRVAADHASGPIWPLRLGDRRTADRRLAAAVPNAMTVV